MKKIFLIGLLVLIVHYAHAQDTTLHQCHAATVSIEPLGNDHLFVRWAPSNAGDSATALEITCIDSATLNSLTVTSSTSPFIIDSLLPGHTYHLIPRTFCNIWYEEGDTLTLTMDTTAICGLFPLPYVMDFDSLTPYSYSSPSDDFDELPPCWHNTYTGSSTSFKRLVTTLDSNNCLCVYTAFTLHAHPVSTPLFDMQGQTIRVIFDYRTYYNNANSICEVGLMYDPDDHTTFVPFGRLSPLYDDHDWHEVEFFFTPEDNRPVALAFQRLNNAGFSYSYYIDNILIEPATDCRRPAMVTVGNITDASASVRWTPQGDYNSSYEIRYCLADGQNNYLYTTTYDTFAILTGLLPDTLYQVWVRNLCDTTMLRPWTSSNVFRTECSCYPLVSAAIAQEGNSYIGVEWAFDESHHRQATEVIIRWYLDNDTSSLVTMAVTADHRNAFIGPFIPDSNYTIELSSLCDSDSTDAITLHYTPVQHSYRPLLMAAPYDSTSILVSWYSNGRSHTLGFSNHADGIWQSFDVTTSPFLLTNLDPSNVYDFYIVETGLNDTAYSDTVSAATLCGTLHIPYHIVYDQTAPTCWTMAIPNPGNYNPSKFFLFRGGMAILPAMDMVASSLQLRMEYTCWNGRVRTLQVGIAESVTDTSTITWVHTLTIERNNNSRVTVDTILPLDNYSGIGRHLVLRSSADYTYFSINRIHLDNLNLCPMVDTVRLDSLQSTSAQISWNPTGTQYRVILSHGNQKDTIFTNDTVATFTNLLPTTDYSARIYAFCDTGDMSLSSSLLTFRTPCEPYATLPFYGNFDNVST